MFACFINPLRFHWSMALKSTSSPIAVSTVLSHTIPTNAEAISGKTIDLQLNPLDNEVFVVTALKIDFEELPQLDLSVPRIGSTFLQASVCKNQPATGAMQTIGNSNCVGSSRTNIFSAFDGVLPPTGVCYTAVEQNAMDTPPATQDYLDIIATDNFFVQVANGEGLANVTTDVYVRVYGYRARADSATYAALVQSEMLSTS